MYNKNAGPLRSWKVSPLPAVAFHLEEIQVLLHLWVQALVKVFSIKVFKLLNNTCLDFLMYSIRWCWWLNHSQQFLTVSAMLELTMANSTLKGLSHMEQSRHIWWNEGPGSHFNWSWARQIRISASKLVFCLKPWY